MNKYKTGDSRYWTDLLVSFGYEPSRFINRDGSFKFIFLFFVVAFASVGVLVGFSKCLGLSFKENFDEKSF